MDRKFSDVFAKYTFPLLRLVLSEYRKVQNEATQTLFE